MSTREQLRDNFYAHEFACKGTDCCGGTSAMDDALLDKLQFLREKYDVTFYISNGLRCQKHNKTIKNSRPTSQHCRGKAVDLYWPEGIDRHAFYRDCLNLFDGVGLYSTFIHLDVRRGRKARWGSMRFLDAT